MWKQIYVNGSSFSDGYGLNISEYLEVLNSYNGEYPSYKEDSKVLNKFKKENSWPGVLESLINIPVINEASFGGSWERVIRMTFDYILKQKDPTKTLYILEMPNDERHDWWSVADEKYKKVTYMCSTEDYVAQNGEIFNKDEVKTIKSFYTQFGNERRKWYDELKKLIMFSSFLKSKSIDFLILATEQTVFCDGLVNIDRFTNEMEFLRDNLIKLSVPSEFGHGNLLDVRTPVDWTNNPLVFYQDYHNKTFKDETKGELDDTHPSLDGCRLLAQEIYKNIQNRYL